MRQSTFLAILWTAFALSTFNPQDAFAQHDPGRDAMKLLAVDKFKAAKERLAKPPKSQNSPISEAERNFVLAILHCKQNQQKDWARTGQTNNDSGNRDLRLGGPPAFQPFPDNNSNSILNPPGTTGDGTETANTPAEDQQAPWDNADTTQENSLASSPAADQPSVCYLGFQVHNRYLVTQDESGMVVIDQHALHERVLYERVCAKVLSENASLESQRLLVPEPVSLTPAERTAALEVKDTLARIGIEIDEFGGETIVIHSYPAMLPKASPGDMLRTLLESVMSAGKQPDPKDLLNHLLSTIACKAAVKAGDPLNSEEITSLLEQKDLYHETHHCPHGRPTALFFSRDELDRMFGRLGPRARS